MKRLAGRLYLVSTPIGNLGDITYRAVQTLKECDKILCEDTRQTKKLCDYFEIKSPLSPLHKMNEYKAAKYLVDEMLAGRKLALVSDAGTPIISDPGNILVELCIQHQIQMECIPGATAFVPALLYSGFDLSQFVYLGFPPHKKGRMTFIKNIAEEPKTQVLYESPHRLIKFLEEYREWVPENRLLSISRELTKKFEETIRGTAAELLAHFKKYPPKGEIVIVVKSEE